MENVEPEDQDSDGEFAFETDHLALRGNKDYSDLLKYIVKLEAQKIQALNDIEQLVDTQNKALEDPLKFIQEIQAGSLNFPPRQSIANHPVIDWNQYGIAAPFDSDEIQDVKPNKDSIETKVRGRKFTDNKPETFNQLWSCQEQKRLEELLEIYPEEPIEARRYKKIAEALGTRTPIQVMSRVQKYFTKLAKAGLPIPGRAPKRANREKSKGSIFYKKSTFFPQLHVPVKMDEQLDNSESSESMLYTDTRNNNRNILELLKAAKEQRLLDNISPVYQSKRCVGCQKSGYLGARWTDNAGTDYCTDCIVQLLPSEKLIPVRQPT